MFFGKNSHRSGAGRMVLRAAAVLTACVLIVMACGGLLFLCGGNDTVTFEEDAVIVLGCGVEGTEPSAQLRCRLDTALSYYRQNPSVLFIVSGGQGTDEDDSEAAVMARYLAEHDVPDMQIILENQAASTAENFRYSALVLSSELPECDSVCFITSDFHIFRSSILARKAGLTKDFESLTHLHAPTPADRILTNLFREPIVFVKSLLFD